MERFTSLRITLNEKDRVLRDDDGTVRGSLMIAGSMFHLHIFFDSQRALDVFKTGVNALVLDCKEDTK